MNPNRSYITVEDESNFLKGSWRLSEQLSTPN
ncbi:MAG: McrC family protein [Candidatus Kapabacteria bacterium]|nr:McrC family protein [Candidatus Kapabacteria bacterium]